jgi:hypothetical protein
VKSDPPRAAKLGKLINNIQRRNAQEVTDPKAPHDFVHEGKRFAYGRTFHHGQVFAAVGTQSLRYWGLPREVQAYLKGGIFDPASYGGRLSVGTIFRASHGRPNPPEAGQLSPDERRPDVRGGGWAWLVGSQGQQEWQALTVTGPARTQFVPTGLDFGNLFDAITEGSEPGVKQSVGERLRHGASLLTEIPRRLGPGTAARAVGKLLGGTMPAGDLLRNVMESSAAIQVGRWGNVPQHLWPPGTKADDPIVARFAIVPHDRPYGQGLASRLARGVRYGKLLNRDAQYQRRGAAATLAKGTASYDVELQFYIDPKTTPLDDSSVAWSRSAAPPVRVATIDLARQVIDVNDPSAFERAVYEHGSFGPQVRAQKLEVPALPAGMMGQDREVPYEGSERTRGGSNEKLRGFLPE